MEGGLFVLCSVALPVAACLWSIVSRDGRIAALVLLVSLSVAPFLVSGSSSSLAPDFSWSLKSVMLSEFAPVIALLVTGALMVSFQPPADFERLRALGRPTIVLVFVMCLAGLMAIMLFSAYAEGSVARPSRVMLVLGALFGHALWMTYLFRATFGRGTHNLQVDDRKR